MHSASAEFEWDPDKAQTNLCKHRASFEDAARVFLYPNRIETFDGREAHGEDRWKTVGMVEPALLAVVYTVRGNDGNVIRLISARKAGAYGARNTMKFKLDPANPLQLTAEQRERLKTIAAMPDAQIDYSDMPRQTGAVQWTRPGALVPAENKQQVTLRLDADVLGFFKGTGKRYQSRINAALREYMNAHRKTGGKKA